MKLFKRSISLTFTLIFTVFIVVLGYSQCDLSDLTVTSSDCYESDLADIIIDFNFSGQGSQGFTVLGNGTNYGNFQYSLLPITLSGLAANCETEYEFIIRDIQDPTCSVFTEFGAICCDDACLIEIVEVNTTECDDDTFSIIAEVNSNSVGVLVDVILNGTVVSQIELVGMEFTLEDISLEEIGINEISICKVDDPECCSTRQFLNPCECATSNITAQIIDCEESDSSYFAIIDFDYVATSDSFQMGYSDGGDNNFLGVFAYNDLPVTAGPIFWSDNERELLIVDKDDFFCFNSAFMGVVDDCDISCQIFNVFAEAYECEDGKYFIDLEFDSEDIEGSTFDVIVDGMNYGSYIYGENTYTVGPINQNCDEAPVLIIQDTNLESCKDFYNFDEPICCGIPCEFTNFEAESMCTAAGEAFITFGYENPGLTEDDQLFVLFGTNTFGPYDSSAGFGEFSLIAPANGTYELMIFVDGNSNCSETTTVLIECEEEPECLISNVFAEAHECIDGFFLTNIKFDYSEVSDSFEIRGNGQSYGIFSYGEPFYTVGPLEGDCEMIYEFVIIDQGNNDCNDAYVFDEPICCSICEYGEMEIGLIDCFEDGYTITIDFEFEDNGDSFTLAYLGDTLSFDYDQLPIELNNLPINTEIEIIATSKSDETCMTVGNSFLENCYDAITESELDAISIMQNAAHIGISNASQFDFNIIVSSISGQIHSRGIAQANSEYNINKNHMPNGVYLISFVNNGTIFSKKIIILDAEN